MLSILMSYVRSKVIYGNTYYYEVKSVREDGKVKQKFVRYVGKSPGDSAGSGAQKDLGTTSHEPARNGEITLYRATDDDGKIRAWTCWTPRLETAKEYTGNPGFGGKKVYRVNAPEGKVLDLTRGDKYSGLAKALGREEEEGREWNDNGWNYPWEESKTLRVDLQKSDYDWIKYVDDYPSGATTMVAIRDMDVRRRATEV
jgi:hypothetical protein